jgi:hypothetical protein
VPSSNGAGQSGRSDRDRDSYLGPGTGSNSGVIATSISSNSSAYSSNFTTSSSASFCTSPSSGHPLHHHQHDESHYQPYPRLHPVPIEQYQQHAQYAPPGPWPPKLNEDGPEFDGEAGFPAFRFDADHGAPQADSIGGFNRQGMQMGQGQGQQQHIQVRPDQGYDPLTKSDLINKYGDGRGLQPGQGQGRSASVFEGTRPNPNPNLLHRRQTASAAQDSDLGPRAPLGLEHTSYDDSDSHPLSRRNRTRQHNTRSEEFEQVEEEGGLGNDHLSSSIAAYWHSDSISTAYHGTGPSLPMLQRAHSAPGLMAHSEGGEGFRDQGMRGIMDLGFDDFMCNPIESSMGGVARSEVRM